MPTNIQGLNIVRPAQATSSAGSQDLLLGQAYPDLAAQLDLWTNLNFESDEPLPQRPTDEHKNSLKLLAEEQEEEVRSPVTGASAIRDGHANVVTPNNVSGPTPQNQGLINPQAAIAAAGATAPASQPFDLNAFLASFGLDAFTVAAAAAAHPPQQQQHVPPPPQQPQQPPPNIQPSLAQLLALHNMGFPSPGLPHFPLPSTQLPMAPSLSRNAAPSSNTDESQAPAKRARTRKASVTTLDSPEESSSTTASPPSAESSSANLTTPLSASEDKRRRNTAASARFRLKKKEREAALESKAKELETKVLELERECEGLRRENGWLKGLVVGVTGVAAQTPSGSGLGVSSSSSSSTSSGLKRSRDDSERA